jgi:hypothetical protein
MRACVPSTFTAQIEFSPSQSDPFSGAHRENRSFDPSGAQLGSESM